MQLKESTKRKKCRKLAQLAEGVLSSCYMAVGIDWDQVDVLIFDNGDTRIPQDLIDFAVDHNCTIKIDDCTAEQDGRGITIYNLVPVDKKGGFRV